MKNCGINSALFFSTPLIAIAWAIGITKYLDFIRAYAEIIQRYQALIVTVIVVTVALIGTIIYRVVRKKP